MITNYLEMKIKTTMRDYFIYITMTSIYMKKTTNPSIDKEVEKLKPSCLSGGNVKWWFSLSENECYSVLHIRSARKQKFRHLYGVYVRHNENKFDVIPLSEKLI